jgi:hypothetical protein
LIIWRRPKIMFKPNAMRAMIKPQTIPFKMATAKLETTNLFLLMDRFKFKILPFLLKGERGDSISGN